MIVDGSYARDPFLLKIGDKWVMYYTATSSPAIGNHIVAYATSYDLVSWETAPENVAFWDESYGTIGGPTESPTVVKRGAYYYLFIGPRSGYRKTGVYRSKDPLNFRVEDIVGQIDAHAAEAVQDNQGNWYVSHCGWRQKGVYLAPLYWVDEAEF
jgi:beta-fructofuranosidase